MAVIIRPHKELTVQKLVGVMDALRDARIAQGRHRHRASGEVKVGGPAERRMVPASVG